MTDSQRAAEQSLHEFLADPFARVAILRGYAGTGKTTLLARLARFAERLGRPVALLAPTGRGARVLATTTGRPARTIHAHIFALDRLDTRATSTDDPDALVAAFRLRPNHDPARTLYLVDEASMIPDTPSASDHLRFGSGRLLADLLTYALRDAPHANHQIIFAGDPAQLPPVEQSESPALDPAWFHSRYGLEPLICDLTEVVRQHADHPVLALATALRDALRQQCFCHLPIEDAPPGLRRVEHFDVAAWTARLREHGAASAVVITDSNARALRYNRAIRAELFGSDHAPPRPGDRLVVAANSYCNALPLLNGDVVELLDVDDHLEVVEQPLAARAADGTRQTVPLAFRRVVLRPLAAEAGTRLELRILETTLDSEDRDISPLQHQALFVHFLARHRSLNRHSPDFVSALFRDPWYTALRVKYAYALTAHKAQGGEWSRVLVDMATHCRPATAAWFRWAYTAVTRARDELWLLHAPSLSPDLRPDPGDAPGLVRLPETIRLTRRADDPELPAAWLGDTPFLRAAVLALTRALREAGLAVTGVTHAPWLIRLAVQRDGRALTASVHYNARSRLSTALTPPDADPELAGAVHRAVSPLLNRPFELSDLSLPVPAAPLPPHAPFPDECPHPGMRRFDELHRAALADAPLRIASIEILSRHQLRYLYRDAAGAQAAIVYHFNRAGACTSHTVDARRTTSAELAGRILAIPRAPPDPP